MLGLIVALVVLWQFRLELAQKAVDHFAKTYDLPELTLEIQELTLDGIKLENITI